MPQGSGNGFWLKYTVHSMKSSSNCSPISHRLSPRFASLPVAMKPLRPLIVMSSTLGWFTCTVLRSRPIGLLRYQENEK
jgi:hypothetical protein